MINHSLAELSKYCIQNSSSPSEILKELDRETHLKTLAPQMMTGPLQGELLAILSHMLRPVNILEIGTFTGYGTICLAQGLQGEGRIYTIEFDKELKYLSHKYFEKAGIMDKVVYLEGDAKKIIPDLNVNFDMVYIDAGKQDYAFYYDHAKKKMKPGGIIMADNVLWSGKVLMEKMDKETKAIYDFNAMVTKDDEVDVVILPVRDGLSLIRIK